jgi:hypothetical protein
MTSVADRAGSDEDITATLTYDATEPFSVRASFVIQGCEPVHWVLARDLLREGVALPSGLGDVRIYPGESGFLLELRSDNGRAFLYGPIEPLVEFVGRMYGLVADGAEHEHFSFEAELERLVAAPVDSTPQNSDPA